MHVPEAKLVWLGIPFDKYSSYLKGCAQGPDAIFKAFHSDSSNYYSESLTQLLDNQKLLIGGVLPIESYEDIFNQYRKFLKMYPHVIGLGGDHSITYPILRAYAESYGKLNVLQFDAHPDLYPELGGNPFSHACPFNRAHEDNLIGKHIQVGLRSNTAEQARAAQKYDVIQYHMRDFPWKIVFNAPNDYPWYVSIDLDVLDPAAAPGVSHYEPGGLSNRQLLSMIQNLEITMVGADIVELNPSRDYYNMTAMIGAKLLKELSVKML